MVWFWFRVLFEYPDTKPTANPKNRILLGTLLKHKLYKPEKSYSEPIPKLKPENPIEPGNLYPKKSCFLGLRTKLSSSTLTRSRKENTDFLDTVTYPKPNPETRFILDTVLEPEHKIPGSIGFSGSGLDKEPNKIVFLGSGLVWYQDILTKFENQKKRWYASSLLYT